MMQSSIKLAQLELSHLPLLQRCANQRSLSQFPLHQLINQILQKLFLSQEVQIHCSLVLIQQPKLHHNRRSELLQLLLSLLDLLQLQICWMMMMFITALWHPILPLNLPSLIFLKMTIRLVHPPIVVLRPP